MFGEDLRTKSPVDSLQDHVRHLPGEYEDAARTAELEHEEAMR